ncbi:MAG: caspase family protein [Crocosphaera sp.]|nr:caspase family protein [Crocosphaera sp.]
MVNESDYPKRIAFIVAPVTGKELQAIKRDVSEVFIILTDSSLGNCHPTQSKLIPECLSKEQFESEISAVLKFWNSSDQFIFYFSGHGEMIKDHYCFKFGEENYAFKFLLTHLEINKVNRAIIILDSCHSGGAMNNGSKSSGDSRIIKEDDIPEGIAMIASSRQTQESRELEDRSQSVFTHLFCKGIKSGLDNEPTDNGLITIGDIVTYVNNKLSQEDYSSFPQKALYHIDKSDQNIWITKNITNHTKKESNNEETAIHRDVLNNNTIIHSPNQFRVLSENTAANSYLYLDVSIDDLDLDLLKEYSDKEEPGLFESNKLERVLQKLSLLYSSTTHQDTKNLHKAAVLCFHKKPHLLYPQAKSIFTAGNLHNLNFKKKYIYGPLSYQFDELFKCVQTTDDDTIKESYIGSDGKRRDVTGINMVVLREIISNAIAHRNYEESGNIKVSITEEAVEVSSPGSFPNHKSWDELVKSSFEVLPEATNPKLAEYLRVLESVEEIGRGFSTFRKYIEMNGKDSLTCREDYGSVCVRLLRNQSSQEVIQGYEDIQGNPWDGITA